jgi:uncharacterized membrane protein YkvI
MKSNWFQRFLLPGFIIQSAIIAGAYGSGKELEQFFLGHGPAGGLLGMTVTMLIFSAVLIAAYEFARKFQVFDYRSFAKALLGPLWPLYEILYVLMMILVLSIVGAVAGDILRDTFGLPSVVGVIGIMLLIAVIVFYGSAMVERVLAAWSLVLFATYIAFLGWHLVQNGDEISRNLSTMPVGEGWIRSGIQYAGYNLSTVPALVFCIRHLQKRSDAVIAGAIAGPLAMLPAMLFFVAMIGQYDLLAAPGENPPLPITVLLQSLHNAGFFVYLFPIVLFGTFVETGVALIHGVNERIDHTFAERGLNMPNWLRTGVAIAILVAAMVIADSIGLTSLVAKGYGTITWGFLLVFILPLLTYGVWLIMRARRHVPAQKAERGELTEY